MGVVEWPEMTQSGVVAGIIPQSVLSKFYIEQRFTLF